MLLTNQIANVLESQRQVFVEKNIGLTRESLNKIPISQNFATIITGIRRCGKSTLMHQLMHRLNSDFIYLNFEDTRLISFEPSDFNRLSEIIFTKNCNTLFFDEIQLANKWEVFVRQKLDEGFNVIITGSNATLLSSELGTSLTGRHLNVELFPFSYSEFLNFKGLSSSSDSLSLYLTMGGFPEYLKNHEGTILNQLMDDILVRDIAIRYSVRDVSALKQLALFLISNIGKPRSCPNETTFGGRLCRRRIIISRLCLLIFPVKAKRLTSLIRQKPAKIYSTEASPIAIGAQPNIGPGCRKAWIELQKEKIKNIRTVELQILE